MKKSTLYTIVILGIMVYPFKIAYLTPTDNNIVNLFCFLIVVFGALGAITINSFGRESEGSH